MKTYLVGGAVRDKLLGLPVKDKDWVVVGATPEDLIRQGFRQVGNAFPVFLHPQTKEEYALARTERKSGSGYKGFICDFNPNITLEEDLMRRDLTINAIAETVDGDLVDPYHGISDLKNRQLRHVSLAFREDPLRVLRVARFAARFSPLGFTIAPETMQLMKEIASSGEINALTPERIWQETEKALHSEAPEVFFSVLQQTGALSILFPELVPLFSSSDPHTTSAAQTLHYCATVTKNPQVRFATLFQEVPTLNNNSLSGCHAIRQLCIRLKIPSRYQTIALLLHEHYDSIVHLSTLSATDILRLFDAIDVWRHGDHLDALLIGSEAIFTVKNPNTEKGNFPQAALAQALYQVAKHVDTKDIIADGHQGIRIKNELKVRRLNAIEKILMQSKK